MSQEILEKCVRIVDNRWRLFVPASVMETLGTVVLLKLNAEDCIEMKKFPSGAKNVDSSTARRIKNGRITIPHWLRNSTSFYCGKKVMTVLRNGHCEIWPWR